MERGGFVIGVAIGARENAFGAEFSEAFVEFFSCAAEVAVVFVSEGENGVMKIFETRRGDIFEGGPERGGVVGRISVAPGAGDEEKTLCLFKGIQ